MTMSTMDLKWSPKMGGKEGLSALGYTMVISRDQYELWQQEIERVNVSFMYIIQIYLSYGERWMMTASVRKAVGLQNFYDDPELMGVDYMTMHSIAKRMREKDAELKESHEQLKCIGYELGECWSCPQDAECMAKAGSDDDG